MDPIYANDRYSANEVAGFMRGASGIPLFEASLHVKAQSGRKYAVRFR